MGVTWIYGEKVAIVRSEVELLLHVCVGFDSVHISLDRIRFVEATGGFWGWRTLCAFGSKEALRPVDTILVL